MRHFGDSPVQSKTIIFGLILTLGTSLSSSSLARSTGSNVGNSLPSTRTSKETTRQFNNNDPNGFSQPVKEVLDGQAELDKQILDRFKLFDAQTNFDDLKTVPVKCFAQSPMAGVPGCETGFKAGEPGFRELVTKMVREKLAYKTDHYYKGESVDWLTGEKKQESTDKTCNLTNKEDAMNFRSEACGNYCQFRISVGMSGGSVGVSGCERERAWFRGAQIQAWNHYKEKVFAEFKEGNVAMTDYSGPRPCAPIGADIMRFQEGNELLSKKFSMNMGQSVLSRSCESKSLENNSFMNRETDTASQAVCDMTNLQTRLNALWATLLMCEIHARTTKDTYHDANNVNGLMGAMSGSVISPCRKSVCTMCSSSTRNRRVNSCYQSRITGFLANQLQTKYKTTEPLEMPKDENRVPASSGN